MAPEMVGNVNGFKEYGTNVDIWGLGVIIFELLTFRRPFDDEN